MITLHHSNCISLYITDLGSILTKNLIATNLDLVMLQSSKQVSSRVFGKLRSAITYLAISEVMQYFTDADIDLMDIALLGIVVFIVSGAFVHVLDIVPKTPQVDTIFVSASDVQHRLLQSVNRLSIMLSGQALALWAQPTEFDAESPLSLSQTSSVVVWIIGMLAVLSLLPGSFTSSHEGSSFQSVLLYTFTNGIEAQFYKMKLDPFILFCMALTLMYYLQVINDRYMASLKLESAIPNVFRSMLHEASCMVLANVCIVGVLTTEQHYAQVYSNVLLLAQLTSGVILVGLLAEKIQVAASVQTLILWRTSKEVWEWIYSFTTDDMVILISLCMLYMLMRKIQTHVSLTIILLISKHVVTISLREIQNLPQVPSIIASYVLLLGADILTANF